MVNYKDYTSASPPKLQVKLPGRALIKTSGQHNIVVPIGNNIHTITFMISVYLPVAEMSIAAESILMLGAAVGFLSGVFGVGGGFLTTPFLIFMGLPPAVAVGTQANQLVASSLTGVLGYWRRDGVDFKMAGVMLGGSFFGTLIGVLIFKLFQAIGQIDLLIPVSYVLILGGIGAMMLYESASSLLIKKHKGEMRFKPLYQHDWFKDLPYAMKFPKSRLYMSALLPGGIGFVGGVLVSVMGIGGGFLLVPAMIYILGMPSLLVAGTSLMQIMVTTGFATMMHAVANHTVDMVLALLLILGGVVGAQIGVRATKYVRGALGRVILALILLAVSMRLAGGLFIEPLDLYVLQVE